jgi:hypothetical protein
MRSETFTQESPTRGDANNTEGSCAAESTHLLLLLMHTHPQKSQQSPLQANIVTSLLTDGLGCWATGLLLMVHYSDTDDSSA